MALKNEKHSGKIMNREDVQKLVKMLAHHRPSGAENVGAYESFLSTYIEPVFGKPDRHGNYVKIINDSSDAHPRIAYMSHHDTVHKTNKFNLEAVKYYTDGFDQTFLCVDNSQVPTKVITGKRWDQQTKKQVEYTYNSPDVKNPTYADCLGADCTTGVWLMLEMIETGCPGVYVIHAEEEVGCMGSGSMVTDYNKLSSEEKEKHWISKVDIALSFDRFGETSIITYQSGYRTASEKFSESLSKILSGELSAKGYDPLKSDDGGSYTDSNEYVDVIKECSNLSVGYYSQHGSSEKQNVSYLLALRDALVLKSFDMNDPSVLIADRDPKDTDYLYGGYGGYGGYSYGRSNRGYSSGSSGYRTGRWDDWEDEPFVIGNRTDKYAFPVYDEESRAANILSNDMIPIEDFINKKHLHAMHSDEDELLDNIEQEADIIGEWLSLYPFLSSYLLASMKISSKDFILNLKREAVRQGRYKRFQELFDDDKLKMENNAKEAVEGRALVVVNNGDTNE